jgi:hypothetical protein
VKIGAWYVVTKPSDDGTFEVGDHISLCSDGAIACKEAQGWIDAEDAEESMRGFEVTLDSEWLDAKRSRLLADLEKLDGLE